MIDEIKGKGVTIYDLPDTEEAKWFKEFQEATRNWVADLEKKGLAGQGSCDHVQQDSRKPGDQGRCRPA